MKRKRLGWFGVLLWLVVTATLVCGCTPGGSNYAGPLVLIVPDSRSVTVIDPNVPFVAKRRSVVLDVGYYLELADLEADVASGKLKRIEP